MINIIAYSLLVCCLAFAAPGSAVANILVDSGHSPKTIGALSCTGIPEYRYNNALAAHVVAFLQEKQINAELTRADDQELGLEERAKKSAGKDLLISLHHDSVQRQFLSKDSTKNKKCSTKAQGFSIFVTSRNPEYARSVGYAYALAVALIRRGLTPSNHHSEPIKGENRKLLAPGLGIYVFDDLTILHKSTSPAIMLEAAVIVDPMEAQIADRVEFRNTIAKAIYEMIKKTKPAGENRQKED